MPNKRTKSFKAGQLERLKDPRYAAQYVNAAIEGGDNAALLLALRNVAEAQSVTTVAQQAGVTRENVYRMLSETGNPCYTSLQGILGALGLRFNIQPVAHASEKTYNYASVGYSPLVWEVSDRPDRRFSSEVGEFAKELYWHENSQAEHSEDSFDVELVA